MGGVFSSPKVEAAPVVDTSAKDRAAAEEKRAEKHRNVSAAVWKAILKPHTGGFLK